MIAPELRLRGDLRVCRTRLAITVLVHTDHVSERIRWSGRERTLLVAVVVSFTVAVVGTIAIAVDFASPGLWWTVAGGTLSGLAGAFTLSSGRKAKTSAADVKGASTVPPGSGAPHTADPT